MALRDDIAAVRADSSRSEDQKRADVYQIKVNGLVPRLSQFVKQSWTLDGVTYRLNAVSATTSNGVLALTIDLTRTRSGYRFDPFDRLTITNPPIARNGKAVDEMTSAEIADFARALLAGLPGGKPA